ncbi:hypothetical protein R5R35_007413 [Gryllus longicercus]|uniref:Uncharacterized protein n=1 Tax=Gryllus longicercus TaxID=2509291 RepID=A0AAN9VI51_9ORTH
MDKDDSVKMLAESIVKIESVKEEADENLETPDWNFTILSDVDTWKNTIKEEDEDEEELEPLVTVFGEPEEVMEEENVKEYEDPLWCSDNLSNAVFEQEESLSSSNTGT